MRITSNFPCRVDGCEKPCAWVAFEQGEHRPVETYLCADCVETRPIVMIVGKFHKRNARHSVFLVATPANMRWIHSNWSADGLARYKFIETSVVKERDPGNLVQDKTTGEVFHVMALSLHDRFIEWGPEDAYLLKYIGAIEAAPPSEYNDERAERLGSGTFDVPDDQAEGGARVFYVLDLSRNPTVRGPTTAGGAHFIYTDYAGLPDLVKQQLPGNLKPIERGTN